MKENQLMNRIRSLIRSFPVLHGILRSIVEFYRYTSLKLIEFSIPVRIIRPPKPNHGLPTRLNVSLTSYPARFETLHLTLISILTQSIAPDRIVLWVAYEDISILPSKVTQLTKYGLEIKECKDLRSYTKIIPMLRESPNEFIITADDDIYYPREWLSQLVHSYLEDPIKVICHRGHLIRFAESGLPLPYNSWQIDTPQQLDSPFVLQTGVGGVLYAPETFDPTSNRRAAVLSLYALQLTISGCTGWHALTGP
ncbi:hypothetical protein CDEF62S_06103 [Castellaniella defragrans]